jgi:glycosyltransferase domain-containing protein
LILDSSNADVQASNSSTLPHQVEHIRFDPSIDVFSKLEQGIAMVKTPYCSFCADDDILFVDSVRDCTRFLETHPDYAAAHGYYFNFQFGDRIVISSVVYWSNTLIDDLPLGRLVALMKHYEAVFYATYRTEVLRGIFSLVHGVDAVLCKELILGVATVLRGKVYRLPHFYYGRSTDASHPWQHWHPHEILAKSPEVLLSDYLRYRQTLVNYWQSINGELGSQQLRVFDLAHLRYFQNFLAPDILDFIIDRSLTGENGDSIAKAVWTRWVNPPRSALIRIRSTLRAIFLHVRAALHIILDTLGKLHFDLIISQSLEGHRRIYRFKGRFLKAPSAVTPCEKDIRMIVANLNRYM